MGEEDLEQLRKHGFSDEQITVATQVIAYFNYINRVADALGVDDDPWMTLPRDEWQRRKGSGYGAMVGGDGSCGRRIGPG